MIGDKKNYPMEKFIQGVVAKLIRTYKISDFVVESFSGKVDSDFRQDMIQTGWLAALQAQKSKSYDPKRPDAADYLRQAVVNALLKFEQKDRPRRDKTDDIKSAENVPEKPTLDIARYDLQLIITKAKLTPSERLATELFYGLTDHGECNSRQIAYLMDKPECWVNARLRVAKIKMQVAARV